MIVQGANKLTGLQQRNGSVEPTDEPNVMEYSNGLIPMNSDKENLNVNHLKQSAYAYNTPNHE
jgi:hypothetical protein